MLSARRLALLAVVAGLAGVSRRRRMRDRPALFPETITTAHFADPLHRAIRSTRSNANATTYQIAGDLAAHAERAYATLVSDWGYPAPLNDGDGLIDIWVQDLGDDVIGMAAPDAPGNTATGWISIDVGAATSQAVIAHELMHLIQFGQWIPADSWLLEGTAEWAGFIASGYQPFGGSIESTRNFPDMSLNCVGDGLRQRPLRDRRLLALDVLRVHERPLRRRRSSRTCSPRERLSPTRSRRARRCSTRRSPRRGRR